MKTIFKCRVKIS